MMTEYVHNEPNTVALASLTPGTRFIVPATGRTGRLVRVGPGSATVEVDVRRERTFVPSVGPEAGLPVTISKGKERTQWSLATSVVVDDRPLAQEVRAAHSSLRRLPKALQRAAANSTTTRKRGSTMGQFNERANAVIDVLELQSIPELADKMGVGKAQLYQALKQDREGAEVENEEVLAALAALEDSIGSEETTEGTEASDAKPAPKPAAKGKAKAAAAAPKPAPKPSAAAKPAKASKAKAKAKAKEPKVPEPRQPAIFWHSIGDPDAAWFGVLVERGEIPAHFTSLPGDKGEQLLRSYVEGDRVIAFAKGHGAVGVGTVRAGDYALLTEGDEGMREDGILCHRLGVDWKATSPDFSKAISAPDVKTKFGIYHPISTAVKIGDQAAAEKLVKALVKKMG